MTFFDCEDGTIINLEQIVFIDVYERRLEFSNGCTITYSPELFESIMCIINEEEKR